MYILRGYHKNESGLLTRTTMMVEAKGDSWRHAEMGWEICAKYIPNSSLPSGQEVEITGDFIGSFLPDLGECERVGMPVFPKDSVRYHAWINGGSLGRTIISADSIAEAHADACDWALHGDWSSGVDDVRVTTWPVMGGDLPDADMIENAGYETPLESTVRVGESGSRRS